MIYASLKEFFQKSDSLDANLYNEYSIETQIENYCKLFEMITYHYKLLNESCVEELRVFSLECIRKIEAINCNTMKNFKARLLTYLISDMFRFLGKHMNHIDSIYELSPFNDIEFGFDIRKHTILGNLLYLDTLTNYEEDDGVAILMPYTDSLRFMTTNYIYSHTKVHDSNKKHFYNKVIKQICNIRKDDAPNKKWL